MAERVDILVKIKKAEEESDRKIKDAQEKAAAIVEEAKQEVVKMMEKAESQADAAYVAALDNAKKEAEEKRDELIEGATKAAKGIKGVEKKKALDIASEMIGKTFGV